MKIITITGKQNTGKTTIIKKLYEHLLSQGAFVCYYDVTGAHFEDIHAVVIWKRKVICICSVGDDNLHGGLSYIEEGIQIAKKYGTEILINALTTKIKETDYQMLLKKYNAGECYIPCPMKDNLYKIECIKHNQERLDFILRELEK